MPSAKQRKKQHEELAQKTHLPVAIVEGVITDMANPDGTHEKHYSNAQLCKRWDITYGKLNQIRAASKIEIAELRNGMATKAAGLSNALMDAANSDIMDDAKLEKMSIKDKVQAAKQMGDMALNLSNGAVGAQTHVNIGEIKVLQQLAANRRRTPLREKLIEAGKDPERLIQSTTKDPIDV